MKTNENENYNFERVIVADLLVNLPFNTSLCGYKMLTEAILISLENSENKRMNMTKDVYQIIAQARNINKNSVEKGIKMAIESVTNNVTIKDLNCPSILIKNALIDGRPKNFIMAMCETVNLKKLKKLAI